MAVGTTFPEVLAAARAGAAWAFEVLYRDLAPSVTGYLRLHGALEPDDLASESFIGLFTSLSTFDGDEGALRAWVFTIAHRRLVDDWRRRSRRPQVRGSDADLLGAIPGGDVEEDALAALGSVAVHELCAALPDDQRAAILMRIVGDLSLEQVADAMDRSVGAVKALQRRGLLTLRSELERTGVPL
ncbi:RNA polymerase sigma factor [Blastococcus capsensis]|uniref:RNA polymerase sigma factor n=1 Tax=Blastococcus capsensis TaxID=1564163 RepID=UPI002540BB87|nr:RNA polymerase sigma factor [Blastococcus capsensis]MDK3255002.1 RNA polymerase sigma factor [Blastococcus capsensis]